MLVARNRGCFLFFSCLFPLGHFSRPCFLRALRVRPELCGGLLLKTTRKLRSFSLLREPVFTSFLRTFSGCLGRLPLPPIVEKLVLQASSAWPLRTAQFEVPRCCIVSYPLLLFESIRRLVKLFGDVVVMRYGNSESPLYSKRTKRHPIKAFFYSRRWLSLTLVRWHLSRSIPLKRLMS